MHKAPDRIYNIVTRTVMNEDINQSTLIFTIFKKPLSIYKSFSIINIFYYFESAKGEAHKRLHGTQFAG